MALKKWMVATLIPTLPIGLLASNLNGLKEEALKHPGAYSILRDLTDRCGPRLTGSEQDARAAQWALAIMRDIGLQSVHAEPWQLERGWTRGHARARLTSPFPLELAIASQGWTGSTPQGETEAEVVAVDSNHLREATTRRSSEWAGKVLFISAQDPNENYPYASAELPAFLKAAKDSGAVAVLERDSRPGTILAHTGSVLFTAHPYAIAFASLAQEQADLLTRVLRTGVPVRLRIDIQNQFTSGEVSSRNIVGEIPGTLHPEEIVIMGAHLDSWDQATGAVDDGNGVAAILGAAKSILSAGIQPERTIRFILFTGEEQGLLGSRAYVRQHQSEMKNVDCALVLDWGSGPIRKFLLAGHDEFSTPLKELFQVIGDVASIQVGQGYTTYTDVFSFILAGVPGISPFQDSPNYMEIGHSAADTLGEVDAATLNRNSAVLALSGVWIANYPARIGAYWSAERTEQILSDQRQALQLLSLWPF
jgi:hypothetical protein